MDIMLERILELVGDRHGAGKELCDALGIKPNMVTEWRKGRVKSYTKYAPQIAKYYGVSLDWLSGLSDQKEKPAPQTEDELNAEIIKLYGLLNAKNQDAVLEIAKSLLSTQ
jgi:transcriptional regulator with XRE-family HTH domain